MTLEMGEQDREMVLRTRRRKALSKLRRGEVSVVYHRPLKFVCSQSLIRDHHEQRVYIYNAADRWFIFPG